MAHIILAATLMVALVTGLAIGSSQARPSLEKHTGARSDEAVAQGNSGKNFHLQFNVRQTDRCQKKKERSIFIYGRCPSVCKAFDPATISADFVACSNLRSFGCKQKPCTVPGSPYGIACIFDESYTAGTEICPDDKIVFDGISINEDVEITYKIDLDAAPVQTDLYLLADNTGSMKKAIQIAKIKAADLTEVFGQRENVAFGIGRYKDEIELSGGFEHQVSLTENKAQAQAAIRNWEATGGGDAPEANLVALYKLATDSKIGWRPSARKFVVIFGDVPGHEPTCLGSTVVTRDVVAREFKKRGITVVGVDFGDINGTTRSFPLSGCGGKKSAPAGQLKAITDATGGKIFESNDQLKLVQNIKDAIESLKRVYSVDESECEANIDSTHVPSFPLTLGPTVRQTVSNTIKMKPPICKFGTKFSCRYKYTESGAAISGGATIEFVNIRGCEKLR